MQEVENHGKYLGIPTVIRRSKKATFVALKDRIWKKLKGWKEKLLSRAGKEVLLKFVIQAIPSYLMGVYKIPISVIQDIHSMMAKFWWGGSDSRRTVHWQSWKALCRPKCLGGLGFRNLEVFNEALLGRQAWRILSVPSSLLARVMKAKYFPNCDFLDSYKGNLSSYSWRSIWGVKALLKEGLIWRVGGGSKIDIWKDPWVADELGRYITTPATDSLRLVHELMNTDCKEWNYELLSDNLNDRDNRCIMVIPISDRLPLDSLTWAFSMDGKYSVKTAYMLAFYLENLYRCVRDLWRELDCEVVVEKWGDLNFADLVESWSKLNKKKVQIGVILMWNIWQRRNEKVFKGKEVSHFTIAARSKRLAGDYNTYSQRIYGAKATPSCIVGSDVKVWQPPLNIIKLHCDAHISSDGWIGLGVVARDSQGHVLFAATRRIRGCWPPAVAECKAVVMAARLAHRFNLKHIILESDCKEIMSRRSKGMIYYTPRFHSRRCTLLVL